MTHSTIKYSLLLGISLTVACSGAKPKSEPVMPRAVRAQPRRDTAKSFFEAGVKAMAAKDWARGRVQFEQALSRKKSLSMAQYNLGLCLQKMGELDAAATAYALVRKARPDFVGAALNLAKVRRDQARYKDGISVLAGLRKTHPYDGPLLNDLAVLYRLNKQYKLATKTLERLLSRDADNVDAHKNLALVYYDQGNYRLAEFMMGTAKRRDDKDPGVYNNLGMIAMKRGDLRRALGYFQKTVKLDPNFVQGHLNIGGIALKYRDYQRASEAFSKAINLDASSWEGHLYYAMALEGSKDLEGAAREYGALQKIRPEYPEAAYGLCKALQSSKPDDAQTQCERFIKMKGAPKEEVANAKQRIDSIKTMREINATPPAADSTPEVDPGVDDKAGPKPGEKTADKTAAAGDAKAVPAQEPQIAPGKEVAPKK